MKFQLRERDRRALLGLGLAVVIYVVLSQFAVPALDSLQGAAESASEKEEQLMKYRRALVRKGHYVEMLEQARKNAAEAEGRLIRGDNPSLASVELQTIVEEAAKKFDLQLGARNMSAARKQDEYFNELQMTISFECTPGQMVMFLSEIRSAPKFISVRTAQVAPARPLHEAPRDEDFHKIIRVNLTLAAILSSPPAASKG